MVEGFSGRWTVIDLQSIPMDEYGCRFPTGQENNDVLRTRYEIIASSSASGEGC